MPFLIVPDVVVVKLGGSVLTGLDAFHRSAAALGGWRAARPHERFVVVVSAQYGTTDGLQRLAEEACPAPDARLLDLLWSTGELHSVALLALCLQKLGVDAAGLSIHQCGLEVADGDADGAEAQVNPRPLLSELRRHPVVVVPGFFARAPEDSVVSLGRGGSDLTAVLLAAALQARRCELIKDVPGYFSKDPNKYADAVPLAQVTYDQALALAAAGCDLVQPRALVAAARTGMPLLIRSLDDAASQTQVTVAADGDMALFTRAARRRTCGTDGGPVLPGFQTSPFVNAAVGSRPM